jgi:hypothetical protein
VALRIGPAAALAGGALIAVGAFLPWLSFYAGLVPIRGVAGLYGRLLAGGGAACCAAGVLAWARPARRLARGLAVLEAGLAAFTIWLVVQLMATLHALESNRMIVPRLGPGLFIALAGSLVALAGAGRAAWRQRA